VIDVLFVCPWKGGGSWSASLGAAEHLQEQGFDARLTQREMAPAKVFALMGLDVRLAVNARAAFPEAGICLVNHSPWQFLAREQDDWRNFLTCLNWARGDGRAAVCQVAGIQFRDAVDALGADGIDLLPAVYPDVPHPRVEVARYRYSLLGHRGRPEKNLATQAVAQVLLEQRTGVAPWACGDTASAAMLRDLQDCLRSPSGCVRKWGSQNDFWHLAGAARIGFCCTFADCYSQTAMDFLSQGVPIVGSPAQWMIPVDWQANADDPAAMAETAARILADPEAGATARAAADEAQERQIETLNDWAERWIR
jgi:hypothetical protein